MGIKDKFTTEEWEILTGAPFLAGLAASLSDTTPGCFSKELDSHVKNLRKSRGKYEHSPLITAILDEYYKEGSDEENKDVPVLESPNPSEPGGFEEEQITIGQRLEELADAARIAQEKLPQGEAQEYKQFLYDLAYLVANSAGEGFLGDWGKRISEQEAKFLERLRLALNL
jgi:hypothetical protein